MTDKLFEQYLQARAILYIKGNDEVTITEFTHKFDAIIIHGDIYKPALLALVECNEYAFISDDRNPDWNGLVLH